MIRALVTLVELVCRFKRLLFTVLRPLQQSVREHQYQIHLIIIVKKLHNNDIIGNVNLIPSISEQSGPLHSSNSINCNILSDDVLETDMVILVLGYI
jgi:hypothetical protein